MSVAAKLTVCGQQPQHRQAGQSAAKTALLVPRLSSVLFASVAAKIHIVVALARTVLLTLTRNAN